jgi:peroxiredoxin
MQAHNGPMNILRGFFVIPAIVLSMVIMLIAQYHLNEQFQLAWLGALIAASPLPLFMIYLMFGGVARTSRHLPWALAIAMIGVIVAGLPDQAGSQAAALFWAATAAAVLFLYVFWYSNLGPRRSTVLRTGDHLPDFALEDADGQKVQSASFRNQVTVILFFRGNWCPLCMAQIRELAGRYQALEQEGIRLVLISPQSQRHSTALAKRFSVAMEFYRDPQGEAARSLGIFHPRGLPAGMEILGYDSDTVMPTLVVCNAAGQVVFLDQTDNYRLRPDPDVFLDIARKA